MKSIALKWRISLLVTVVLIAVIAAISATAYIELRASFLRNIDRTLLAMAKGVQAELDELPGPAELEREVRFITGSSPRRRATRFRVWVEGQAADLIASDTPSSKYGQWLRELPASRRPGPGQTVFLDLAEHGDEYRAVWARRATTRGDVHILIAHSSHYEYHEMQEFLNVLLVVGGSLVIGSAAVATGLVVLAMRPVGQTAERLRRVTYHNLGGEHLAGLDTPAELAPFLAAVTELLGRLDRAARQQKQFTADASHELRTPLSLAKSTLQVARSSLRSGTEYERAIDEALSDVGRIERLIDQLLILARMDEKDGLVRAADVALDDLLRERVGAFDAEAARTGGSVVCEALPPTRVRGDEALLGRMFGNLLDNAIKHGPRGGTVRVTLRHGTDGTCTVGVHDEGGAIPPEALPRLFDRFYRVDSARNHGTGGTGLGLAIARQIARRHGGAIEVTSTPRTGTEVSVHLPRL